jgi:hypothetical protein
MNSNQITDGTISRYCGARNISEKNKPKTSAYRLRKGEEKEDPPYLSFNWLEHYVGLNQDQQVDEMRKIFDKKMDVGATAQFALLEIQAIQQTFQAANLGTLVDIRPFPINTKKLKDPSHCGFVVDLAKKRAIATHLARTKCDLKPAKV